MWLAGPESTRLASRKRRTTTDMRTLGPRGWFSSAVGLELEGSELETTLNQIHRHGSSEEFYRENTVKTLNRCS